ncbi:hypothetical protein Cni_G06311 [Canna indica]|uniref:Uncharacterized protein n=1 Tax=Canna indica TaxID=4628 RepID=A0AAQ3JYA4_9LILI|nr:hypothetical protein Cni_G06311 [Canna indica]
MFCCYALDDVVELGLPYYLFFTSAVVALATFLYLPTLHAATNKSFKELGHAPVLVPRNLPIRVDHMPLPMLDLDGDAYKGFPYIRTSITLSSTHLMRLSRRHLKPSLANTASSMVGQHLP